MEITRRRSERAKVKKATYTPGKLVTTLICCVILKYFKNIF
jgi:hypothetical protein